MKTYKALAENKYMKLGAVLYMYMYVIITVM